MTTQGTGAWSWRRDPRSGWLVLALGALGVLVLVVLLAMTWPAFARLDAAISAWIRSARNPLFNDLASWATGIGSLQVVIPVTVGLMLWMVARRNWAAVVYIFMTVAVGWFIGNDVIKNLIRRPRPIGVNIAPISGDYSMPSGHTLAAFLLFATLCVVVMLNLPTGRHMKRWLAAASTLIIIGVGLSRVYLGVHWFGDVVAACLFGGAWWLFTTATYFGSVTEERRTTPRPGGG
ncbi:MAG TPA: phosphatase PAP2 family protein [Coriobacteriia bacterium]